MRHRASMSVTRFVSTPNPAPASVASLTTIEVELLRLELARPLATASSVSSAKPTIDRASAVACGMLSQQDVRRRRERDAEAGAAPFLIFDVAALAPAENPPARRP